MGQWWSRSRILCLFWCNLYEKYAKNTTSQILFISIMCHVCQIPRNLFVNRHSIKPVLLIPGPNCEFAIGKLKYSCCTETKAKGMSTSSYIPHKVTVSMVTSWWLVCLLIYLFSYFAPIICAISLFEDLFMTTVHMKPLMTTCFLHLANHYSLLSLLLSFSLRPLFWRLNENRRM